MWTLVYLSTEKSLADWGITGAVRTRVSQAQDTFSFEIALPYDVAAPFPYGAELLVYKDRTPSRPPNVTYSEGSVWFRGRVTVPPRRASDKEEILSYKVAGPWWFLDNVVYQQPWYLVTDPVHPAESKVGGFQSHVILNQGINGARLKTDWQIWEAVDYVIASAAAQDPPVSAPLQIPSTDHYSIVNPGAPPTTVDIRGPDQSVLHLPSIDVPFDEAKDVVCSEVIKRQLRWTPDALTWFDYSVNPPAFNCQRRAQMESVTLDLQDPDRIVEEVQISPRLDLQVPAVVLKFEQTNDFNGQQFTAVNYRVYPDNGLTPGTTPYKNLVFASQRLYSAMVSTIDLRGAAIQTVSATIKTALVNPGVVNWWKAKLPWLSADNITDISIADVTRKLEDGSDAHGYNNELVDGQIADWMRFDSDRETISALIAYTIRDESGNILGVIPSERFSFVTTTTPAVSGRYSATESVTFGESIPEGLAEFLFNSTNTVQWDGSIQFVEQECTSLIRPGMKMNVTNGHSGWETMEALVQEVRESIDDGKTSIKLGPATHIGVADLIELLRINRFRFTWTNPAFRTSGRTGGNDGLALGNRVADQNGNSGGARHHRTKFAKDEFSIDVDALAKQLLLSGNRAALPTDAATNRITHESVAMTNPAQNLVMHPNLIQMAGNATLSGVANTGQLAEGNMSLSAGVDQVISDPRDFAGKAEGRVARYRPFIVCVDGKKMRAWIDMTDPEPLA